VRQRWTVLLVPMPGGVAASVPAMPGCVASGPERDAALRAAAEAMRRWLEVEGFLGREPLAETREIILAAVAGVLAGIETGRSAGGSAGGYDLELVSVEVARTMLA
jgi:predicted RNase H-like HicB family nuclease